MKRARYFCEHCGAEVRRDARVCPRCGRFFSSVRCPKCGYSGGSDAFLEGCPVCGYAEAAAPAPEDIRPAPLPEPSLPVWVYVAALAALVAVIAILISRLS